MNSLSQIASSRGSWYDLSVQRIKAIVAAILLAAWLPATLCCLLDNSGLFGKNDCCSKDHSQSIPGDCDKPCGVLASAHFVPEQNSSLQIVQELSPQSFIDATMAEFYRSYATRFDFPATDPPTLLRPWQFTLRTALPARAPSLAS